MKKLVILIFLLGFGNVQAQNFDTRILQSINSQDTKYDKIWLGVTNSATPISIVSPLSLYAMGYFHYLPKGKENAYATAGSLAINSILTFGLKWSIQRERPFANNPNIYKKTQAGSY